MPAQFYSQILNTPAPVADGTALANSTTLTDVSPTTNGVQYSLPAPLYAGQSLWVRAAGKFSTTGTPTLLIGLYYGGVAGTALCATAAVTTGSAVTNQSFFLDAIVTVRTTGTSGTILGEGVAYGLGPITTNAATAHEMPATGEAAVTVDTTTSKTLTVGAQWGTASSSNTLTCSQMHIVALN